MTKALFAAAGAALSLLAVPAAAATVSVIYQDLDLSTPEGARELDRRIETAARKVCDGHEIQTSARIADRSAKDCVDTAKANVKRQVARARASGKSPG